MNYNLYISPCPNDTFTFEALINGRIDCGLSFDPHFMDIDELNKTAFEQECNIVKVSFGVVPKLWHKYWILDSGSALGRGNGPLLISKSGTLPQNAKVAIPGADTTANLLLTKLFPEIIDKKVMLFSDVAQAVLSGECDAGVLIHEGRFTFQAKSLQLIADLGLMWEQKNGLPLPLGAILVNRNLPHKVQTAIQNSIKQSIEFAYTNPAVSADFVRSHAQEISDEVTKSHIEMFVNNYSLTLGNEGQRAIRTLTGLENEDIFLPLY